MLQRNSIPFDPNIDYIDINLIDTSDNNNNTNILDNPLDLFFQEIELSIKVAPNEIWGVKDSINLSRFLFNKYVSITQIKNDILSFIGKNCQHAALFQYNVTVETIKSSDNKDLIYIVVKVNAEVNQQNEEFIQKFLLGS